MKIKKIIAGVMTLTLALGISTVSFAAENEQLMYRMYNPNSGEHFYTASGAERNSLIEVGWNYEGAGLIVCALDAQKAEKINSGYAATIAGHNYSDDSINTCKMEAASRDYVLTVNRYDTNVDGYNDICECILEYDYTLKFLNLTSPTTTNNKHHFSRITK